MKKSTLLFTLFALALIVACKNESTTATTTDAIEEEMAEEEIDEQYLYASNLYQENCATCHEKSVVNFMQKDFLHGNSWNEVNRSIRYAHTFMKDVDFVKTWPDSAFNKLTDYMLVSLEQQTIESFATDVDYAGTIKSENLSFKLDTVVKGLEIPWGIDFLPNGDVLVTDRNGNFYRQKEGAEKVLIKGTPKVYYNGQGGLLDVKVHPDFATNQTIYISYSKPNNKKESNTAVMMAKLINDELVEQKIIMDAKPYTNKRHHFGSRLAFDKAGYLYVTIGDRASRDENPQDLTKYPGKIHRFNADGSIPADNPFVDTEGAIPSIWSYGHRNPQGLVFDETTNTMWETEHAPRGGDEVNIIRKGKNYGWRVISYGINYNGTTFTNKTAAEGMMQPLHYWVPSIAPCGMDFVKGDRYPAWKGNLLVGSLRFEYLNRCKIVDQKIVHEESLLKNIGR
ncbi:MAG: PQQ-dependent sugar dehydrogenase, partial [Saprospiraceae bacterium]